MGLLRATARMDRGWWEIKLLDLAVAADGDSETAMLKQLEHALVAEYLLAKELGQTPFVKLLLACPKEVHEAWTDDTKKFRTLSLPEEVRCALSAVFRLEQVAEFRVETPNLALAA